jgi:hypothetical protein
MTGVRLCTGQVQGGEIALLAVPILTRIPRPLADIGAGELEDLLIDSRIKVDLQ